MKYKEMIKFQYLGHWKIVRISNYLSKNLFSRLLITNGILTPGNFFYLSFMFILFSLFFTSLIWKLLWLTYSIIIELGEKMEFLLLVRLLPLGYRYCFYYMKCFKRKLKANNIFVMFGIILKYLEFLYLEPQE